VTRLRRILLVVAILLVGVLVFVYDVIELTGSIETLALQAMRGLAILGSLVLMAVLALSSGARRMKAPRGLGRLLLVTIGVMLLAVALGWLPTTRFVPVALDAEAMEPANVTTVFVSLVVAFSMAFVAIEALLLVRQLVFHKRKKGTKRTFTAYLVALFASCLLTLPLLEGVPGFLGITIFVVAIVLAAVNSFRQGWVVYLSRREKLYAILYSLFLMITFAGLGMLTAQSSFVSPALESASAPVARFVGLNCILAATYFGMSFVSTLFHLPTAEVYERKQSELSSLHNLSRLVNQVFDFGELVATVPR